MPTGYTAMVQKGDCTFREFALSCSKNFGALLRMRDDPSGTEIPDKFEPSDYHKKALLEAQVEVKRLEKMTDNQIAKEAAKAQQDEIDKRCKAYDESGRIIKNYEAMLSKAKLWEPPTEEHRGMKEFMISQLEESIRFDDMRGYYKDNPAAELDAHDWHEEKMIKTIKNVSRHRKEYKKEVERTEGCNKWISDLRESLPK